MLVLSPHPDDLELSCGLICHKAMTLGYSVYEIIMTDGAAGGIDPKIFYTDKLRRLRACEAKRGGMHVGVNSVEFLEYPDAKLLNELETVSVDVSQRLESLSPDIFVFPSARDIHTDHAATHQSAQKALENYKKKCVTLEYCFWGQDDEQNIVFCHADGIIAKEKAFREYKTQPIESYIRRLYENTEIINGYEQYYSPEPDKTVLVLSLLGFNIRRK